MSKRTICPISRLSLLHCIWCSVLVPNSPVVQAALCVLFSTYSINDMSCEEHLPRSVNHLSSFSSLPSVELHPLNLHPLNSHLHHFTMMNPLSPNSTIALLSIINVFTYSTLVFLLAVVAGPKTYWVLALDVFLRYAMEIQEAYHFGNFCDWSLPYQQRLLCLLAETAYFSLAVDFIRRKAITIWECVCCTLRLTDVPWKSFC